MNKFDYKNLTPFKWFVLENFPFIEADFDALTEWQLFCKLGKEMNKIINSENTLGAQVETLTDYVSNYFDNLDVQEEINNKLNEMVESGYFENLLTNYIKVTKIYNTTSELISDSQNLVVNQKIKTLGYNTINDGGGSYFIIRNSLPNNIYINLGNSLYGEIIIENDKINIKQIGIFPNNDTDFSTTINSLIEKCNNKYIIEIDEGTYNIYNTIFVKPTSQILLNNTVLFNSYNNGVAVSISQTNDNLVAFDANNRYYNKQIFLNGILIVKNCYQTKSSTVGLELGYNNSSSINNYLNSYSFIDLKNIRITGYNKGILLNCNRNYLNIFENIIVSKCNYDIYNTTYSFDSGENIKFINCNFSGSSYPIYINKTGTDLTFQNCSFDFNMTLLTYSSNIVFQYNKINFENCHFEGLGTLSNSQTSEVPIINEYYFVNNNSTSIYYPNISFTNCNYLPSTSINYNRVFKGNMRLYFNNLYMYDTLGTNSTRSKSYSLCDDKVQILKNDIYWEKQYLTVPTSMKLNLQNNARLKLNDIGTFENIADIMTISAKSANLSVNVVTDTDFTRALELTTSETNSANYYCNIRLGKYPIKAGQRIINGLLYKINQYMVDNEKPCIFPIYTKFYDINGNEISNTDSVYQNLQSKYVRDNTDYNLPMAIENTFAPEGSYYCIPILQMNCNFNNEGSIKLTEFFTIID